MYNIIIYNTVLAFKSKLEFIIEAKYMNFTFYSTTVF